MYGYKLYTWGRNTANYPESYTRLAPTDPGTDGVAYVGQDILCIPSSCPAKDGDDYNFFHGSLTYQISSIGCGTIQAFSKYAHTWSSTDINGISIGPWSIGISWSSSSNKWEKASQPSAAVTPC